MPKTIASTECEVIGLLPCFAVKFCKCMGSLYYLLLGSYQRTVEFVVSQHLHTLCSSYGDVQHLCFDKIHQCDRQIDGQVHMPPQLIPKYAYASRGKRKQTIAQLMKSVNIFKKVPVATKSDRDGILYGVHVPIILILIMYILVSVD